MGTQLQIEWCRSAKFAITMQTATASTPSQPESASGGRSVISTRAPSWPTGVTVSGDSELLMTWLLDKVISNR